MKTSHAYRPQQPADILLVTHMAGGVARLIRLGVHTCVKAAGWSTVAASPQLGKAAPLIQQWQPRAALVMFGYPLLVDEVARLVPTVQVMNTSGSIGVPSVDVDDAEVGALAAKHLLSLGARNFAAYGCWSRHWAMTRLVAFEQAIGQSGFAVHRSRGVDETGEPTSRSSDRETKLLQWLVSLAKPVGILAMCDAWGNVMASLCRTAGLRVPEDVAILAVDNDELICEITTPPLSSIAINWQQIGYDAAMLAGRMARGETVEPVIRLVKPTGVVTRQSSDLLAVQDPDVAEALRVIHRNTDRHLTVTEVLRCVNVDRRRLERHFREQVGRRMLQEIRRVHVEHAKRLLISTDLPMPEIASRCGFANATKLGIAFRHETATTPTTFRRTYRLRH